MSRLAEIDHEEGTFTPDWDTVFTNTATDIFDIVDPSASFPPALVGDYAAYVHGPGPYGSGWSFVFGGHTRGPKKLLASNLPAEFYLSFFLNPELAGGGNNCNDRTFLDIFSTSGDGDLTGLRPLLRFGYLSTDAFANPTDTGDYFVYGSAGLDADSISAGQKATATSGDLTLGDGWHRFDWHVVIDTEAGGGKVELKVDCGEVITGVGDTSGTLPDTLVLNHSDSCRAFMLDYLVINDTGGSFHNNYPCRDIQAEGWDIITY